MSKIVTDADEAVRDIRDGATIGLGGFGLCGIPENAIAALVRSGVRDLTCYSNNAGVDGFGIGLLLEQRQVRKMVASYVGENRLFEALLLSGELEVELSPQGTFAERLRAGGAGIPAFYTATGVGTVVADGKDVREFAGRAYVMERAITTDFALVKAWQGDAMGNLVFRRTARNFNPLVAAAGRIAIAEVEELVPLGAIEPDAVHLPGIYIQRIFQGRDYQKRVERRTVRAGAVTA